MIIDALLQFSGSIVGNTVTGQSLVGAGGAYTSTNVIDLAGVGTGVTGRDIGMGEDTEIVVEVTQAFAGGTSMQVQLVTADDAAISVNVTPIMISPTALEAALVVGAKLYLQVDRAAFANVARRYLALQYITVGTATTGAVVAAIVKNVQDSGNNTIFPSGFAIS